MEKEELKCSTCGHEFEGQARSMCPNCGDVETMNINDYYEAQAKNERDDYLEDKRLFGEN